jgi:tetratricopeptide (TPR) repeat protein
MYALRLNTSKKRIYLVITAIVIVIITMLGTHYMKLKGEKDKKVISYIEIGHKHFLKREVDKAYENYQNAWSLKPEITTHVEKNGAVNLAQLMMVRGEYKNAKDLLLKAVEYDPYFYASYLFLGDIYLKEKDADRAIFYLEKGLSLKDYFIKDDPNAALLYYNMAEALLLKGNKDGAKKHLEKFLAIADKDKRLEGIAAKARERLKALSVMR